MKNSNLKKVTFIYGIKKNRIKHRRRCLAVLFITNTELVRFVPLKGKRCVFAWSNFHLEVEKRISFFEFSFGRGVFSLGIVLWCVEEFCRIFTSRVDSL